MKSLRTTNPALCRRLRRFFHSGPRPPAPGPRADEPHLIAALPRRVAVSAAVVLIPLASCSSAREPVAKPAGEPIAVQTAAVTLTEVDDAYRASGTVRARYTAAIAAKIVASIREVRVQSGDRVKPGQVLIVLDSRDLDASLRRAEAALAEAKNALAETENAAAAARAQLDLARTTHQRFEDLLAKRSVSRQEFDESAARLRGAEAAVAMAEAKRRQVAARIEQAEAEAAAAKIALGYATLTAPFAGLVVERRADPGSLATPGTPLLVVEQEDGLRLEAALDESRLALARAGKSVPVELDGLDRTVTGRVAEIIPAVDPATRTLTVKIDLPPTPGLRAGMFGRAAFPAGKRRVLLVAAGAVMERGQIQSVYVVERDTARLRLVSLGAAYGERREVLSGLAAGEKVILNPPAALADGGRVQ
jgi:multidrug efflux system membrane fusion protein